MKDPLVGRRKQGCAFLSGSKAANDAEPWSARLIGARSCQRDGAVRYDARAGRADCWCLSVVLDFVIDSKAHTRDRTKHGARCRDG